MIRWLFTWLIKFPWLILENTVAGIVDAWEECRYPDMWTTVYHEGQDMLMGLDLESGQLVTMEDLKKAKGRLNDAG